MDFVTGLPISTDWKGKSYDLILEVVDRLRKMVYYEPVKMTINAPSLVKVIINFVVWHHGLFDSIITDQGSLFMLNLVLAVLFFKNQEKTLYGFPFSNQWPNRETKQHNGGIPQRLYKLGAEWLRTSVANGQVCIQQYKKRQHRPQIFQTQLRLLSTSFFQRQRQSLLQILFGQQTGKKAKRTDKYLPAKHTLYPKTLEKNI